MKKMKDRKMHEQNNYK